MKRILFVGFYDYSYGYQAYILENNKFKEYNNISSKEYDALYELSLIDVPNNDVDKTKVVKILENILSEFDYIVICVDGRFYYFEKEEL